MRLNPLSIFVLPLATAQIPIIAPQALKVVPGRYIVKVSQLSTLNLALAVINKPTIFTYNFGNFYGFTADLSYGLVAALQKLPGVCFRTNVPLRSLY